MQTICQFILWNIVFFEFYISKFNNYLLKQHIETTRPGILAAQSWNYTIIFLETIMKIWKILKNETEDQSQREITNISLIMWPIWHCVSVNRNNI